MTRFAGKTILVTGASGFIGRALLARLERESGAKLVVLSRQGGALSPSCTRVQLVLEELTSNSWIDHGVERVDIVFHLAGFIPKRAGDANSIDDAFRSNLTGTRMLLESLPSRPAMFVFFSTIDVYAPAVSGPVTESSPVDPPTLYGASKFFCEKLVTTHAREHGYDCAILRVGHTYGPGEDAYEKLIPEAIRALLDGKAPVVFGDGSVLRDFMYVDDVVEAAIRSASLSAPEAAPINVVGGRPRPVRDVVDMLTEISGSALPVEYRRDLPGGRSLEFDNTRMRDTLGSWEQVLLGEGLIREVEYFRRLHA